ncbi:hypothetical protein [Alteromonas flava]|uniref:hypothetical protein n=1 Tax=Alteromonas flava TaxID=2048003 RepID=UPI000C2831C5|nr:hypothetical protein [Alteromonas flava]
MKLLRLLGLLLGIMFVSVFGFQLVTEHFSALGKLIGFGVGIAFICYGLAGRDVITDWIFEVTGYRFNSAKLPSDSTLDN